MDAAVLHVLGRPPRFEQFAEPVVGDGEEIVHVHSASLKPIDKQLASGLHYASPRQLPLVCGTDGVGHLTNGQRVFFGGPRPPTLWCDGATHGCVESIHFSSTRRRER